MAVMCEHSLRDNDLAASNGEGLPLVAKTASSTVPTTTDGAMKVRRDNPVLDNDDDAPLTVWRKVMFAVGAVPYAMCNTVIGFYFSIFLLEVVILDPIFVLIILFSGTALDTIADPIVGYLCTHTKTRHGRLRLWIISAAIPGGVVYTLLWLVPPGIDDIKHSAAVKFVYYLVVYLAFQAILTCFHVPYTALTMHLSHNSKDRDSATLYRMCFEVLGVILGVGIYTFYFVGFVETTEEEECGGATREPNENQRRAYLYHAITVGVILIACILTTFLGVREQEDEVSKDKRIGFFQALKETLNFKPYTILLLTYLFSWLAITVVQGNIALYVKYTAGLKKQYPYVITVLLIATICWMPLWQLVIVKFGKRTAFTVGSWVLLPSLLALLYIDFYPYLIYVISIYGALGFAAAYLLPWSMVPDIIDEAAIKTNMRREELFYASFVSGTKFASGITLAFSIGILKLAGYDEEECEQPWTVGLTIKLIISVLPILSILLSLLAFHFYPITEQSREKTSNVLQERRKSSAYLILRNTTSSQDPKSTNSSLCIPQQTDSTSL